MRSFLLLLLSIFSLSVSAATIDIDHDEDDCKDKRISMDVEVSVDGEIFKFAPSCGFSFDNGFKTKGGLNCKVAAGMCSAFSPKNRFEVSCSDGSSEDVTIDCEPKKTE